MEFEDIRLRLRDTPEQLTVLSELAIRSWRDREIAKIFKKLDDGWCAHLVALLERGVQQGLGRNAAAIKANASKAFVFFHNDDFLAEISGVESCGVSSRPGADYDDFSFDGVHEFRVFVLVLVFAVEFQG